MKRILLSAIALLAATSAQAADCKQTLLASLPMTIDAQGGVAIAVTLDGQPGSFTVDPTLIRSRIAKSFAAKLGLTRLPGNPQLEFFNLWQGQPNYDVSGFVRATSLLAGTVNLVKPLLQEVPDDWLASDTGGAIGSDVLDKVDADFDIGHARLNLFSKNHCTDQVIYWTKDPAAMIPFEKDNEGRPTIWVLLDGKRVRAALDTSNARSYSTFDMAHRVFGMDTATPGLVKNPNDNTYLAKFNTISLEGVTINHPEVSLWDTGYGDISGPEAQLSIGMSVLSKLHIYFDQNDGAIFITAAGAY